MTAHTLPIALPHPNHQQDYRMHDPGSFTGGSSDTFNPAAFTRHFLGSPISWRAGSFGSRFPAGSPTAQLLSSIDLNDWRSGKTPDTDRDSILNALNVFDREGELCRNYTCCGLHLNDLHALLEHFEEVHIVVLDPNSAQPQAHIQIPFNPTIHDSVAGTTHQFHRFQQQQQQQHQQYRQHQPYLTPFDPDDMELDIELDNPPPPPPSSTQSSAQSSPSSGAPSPPDTPISTPLSDYSSPHAFVSHHLPHHLNLPHHSPYISQPPSPLSTAASTYDPSTAASTRQNSPTLPNFPRPIASGGFPRATPTTHNVLAHPEEVFNTYARFASDYSSSMPGAQFNGATVDEASAIQNAQAWQQIQGSCQGGPSPQQQPGQMGVPPALLFASSANAVSPTTGNTSRVPSPQSQLQQQQQSSAGASPSSAHSSHPSPPGALSKSQSLQPAASSSSGHSRPPAPSLLLSKPFRCPKPNCNKSYKQANGLKYHMTHGSCNFAPPKDLEHVKDLLERKRREREGQQQQSGLTRSASLGSVPGPSSSSTTKSINIPPSTNSHVPHTSPPTPTGAHPMSPTSILSLTYSDLSNISEHDLREVEREAERRLRPFACGVGDCQRRYKNMNGLRYHYQHSGDHGAVGLALLASGQHECLGAGKRGHTSSGSGGGGAGGVVVQVQGAYGAPGGRQMKAGSASVPVSRAGSVSVSSSRVGTPQPPSANVGPSLLAQTQTPAHGHNHVRQGSGGGQSGPGAAVIPPTPVSAPPFVVSSPPTTSGSQSQPPSPQAGPAGGYYQAQQAQQQQQQQLAAYHHYAQMQRHYQAQVQAQQQQQEQAAQAQQQQAQQQQVQQQQYAYAGYTGLDYSQQQQQLSPHGLHHTQTHPQPQSQGSSRNQSPLHSPTQHHQQQHQQQHQPQTQNAMFLNANGEFVSAPLVSPSLGGGVDEMSGLWGSE